MDALDRDDRHAVGRTVTARVLSSGRPSFAATASRSRFSRAAISKIAGRRSGRIAQHVATA
jgi:hypothetical protein